MIIILVLILLKLLFKIISLLVKFLSQINKIPYVFCLICSMPLVRVKKTLRN